MIAISPSAALGLFGMAAIAAMPAGPLPLAAESTTHAVKMERVAFAPPDITVHVGDTVEWDNGDIVAHTATSKEAGFDVNLLPGRRGSTVIKAAGIFTYICRYHPNMKGRVVAQP